MKKAEEEEKIKNEEEAKTEKARQEYLKTIKYQSDGENYSFELENKEYKIKGFPSIREEAKILAIYSTIAPGVFSSEDFIFDGTDVPLKALSKGSAYGDVLILSCQEKEKEVEDPLSLGIGKKPDSQLISAFGMCVLIAEIEFKNSKKKQS